MAVHHTKDLIYSVGTQVVTRVAVLGPDGRIKAPQGSVGVVVKAPADFEHGYRVQFPDGYESVFPRDHVVMLAKFKESDGPDGGPLYDRIIYRCVIGSRAYGLDTDQSDTDRRGIFLPTAEQHWSLTGVPEQIEFDATQEAYWELQKFVVMALKSNPNVLECLWSPCVEWATPLANELLSIRQCFLSKLVYQTMNGYVLSQFKKMQTEIRNRNQVKWKHVMHLLRLLLSGIRVLKDHEFPVRVSEHRDQLLAVRNGEWTWDATEAWRLRLHQEFEDAFTTTTLPERPDYAQAEAFVLRARRLACEAALP